MILGWILMYQLVGIHSGGMTEPKRVPGVSMFETREQCYGYEPHVFSSVDANGYIRVYFCKPLVRP